MGFFATSSLHHIKIQAQGYYLSSMPNVLRTTSENKDFIQLVKALDHYLADIDGKDHSFYAQYNKIDSIQHVVVAYEDGTPVGCGAIKAFDSISMEVKRMYVDPAFRNRGIAALVLNELEEWTQELGYIRCVLETGKRQIEAVYFYQKSGYVEIPNYGQYVGVANSVCFEKKFF